MIDNSWQVYTGNIDYWLHLEEMLQIQSDIEFSSHFLDGSIQYWFSAMYGDFCQPEGGVLNSPCKQGMYTYTVKC